MSVSNFEAYQRRAHRLKALEECFAAAKKVFFAQKSGQSSDVFFALAVLKKAVEEVEKLPPLHLSQKE